MLRRLLLLLLAGAGRANVTPLPSSCPRWALEYAQLTHGLNRSTARSLAVRCPLDGRPQGGLGDHLRGVLYALRVAAKHRLLYTIDLPGALSLEGKLDPAHIDWRVDETVSNRVGREVVKLGYARKDERRSDDEFEPLPADNYDLVERLEDAILHSRADIELCSTLWHNFYHPNSSIELPGSRLSGAEADQELHCLWTLLFKPAPMLRVKLAAARQRLYGNDPSPRYVAAHLRLGGLTGEDEKHVEEANEQQIRDAAPPFVMAHAAHLCILDMRANLTMQPGAEPLPALLVTDNAALRRVARSGLMTGVVGPPHTAVHVSRGVPTEADLWTMWVELGLLAGAEYLLRSDSGFSNAAAWWGGQGGVRDMTIRDCVERYGKQEES